MSWGLFKEAGGMKWYMNLDTGEVRGIELKLGRLVTPYKDGNRYMSPKEMGKLVAKKERESNV